MRQTHAPVNIQRMCERRRGEKRQKINRLRHYKNNVIYTTLNSGQYVSEKSQNLRNCLYSPRESFAIVRSRTHGPYDWLVA